MRNSFGLIHSSLILGALLLWTPVEAQPGAKQKTFSELNGTNFKVVEGGDGCVGGKLTLRSTGAQREVSFGPMFHFEYDSSSATSKSSESTPGGCKYESETSGSAIEVHCQTTAAECPDELAGDLVSESLRVTAKGLETSVTRHETGKPDLTTRCTYKIDR